MNKFITSNSDEYIKESERREKIYKDLCKKGEELIKLVNEKKLDHSDLTPHIRELDLAYLDWQDGVIYKYKDE